MCALYLKRLLHEVIKTAGWKAVETKRRETRIDLCRRSASRCVEWKSGIRKAAGTEQHHRGHERHFIKVGEGELVYAAEKKRTKECVTSNLWEYISRKCIRISTKNRVGISETIASLAFCKWLAITVDFFVSFLFHGALEAYRCIGSYRWPFIADRVSGSAFQAHFQYE